MIRRCLLFAIILSVACRVQGQDSHYWTQQYGTKSMLLSGSVIGGVEDLGAVYYNPARLATIENPAFLLSANVYEYSTISVADAFGNAKNSSKSTLKGVPTLAAGTFKIKKWPKHHFAYAILTRQNSDFSFGYRDEVYKDVFTTLPGNEYFGAEISLNGTSTEQWTGLTWAYSLTPKLSVGVTTNYVINSQSRNNLINLQAMSAANEVAVYRYNRAYDYKETGFLWKVALASELGKWKLGLTMTTPMISLTGSGNYRYEEFYSTIPGLGPKPEVYASTYQKGLPISTRSPFSVGFGATRNIGKNKLHLSTEWFQAINKYTVMTAADFPSQSIPDSINSFRLTDKVKSVWNFGVGAEIYINPQISGFLSFSSDFSAAQSDLVRFSERSPEASNSTWNADFYHVGGGFVLDFKWADLTLGATHTGAQQTIPRPVNFPEKAGDKIFGTGDTADVTWDRWRFVFSFSFPFLKEYAKKLEEKGSKKDDK